MSKIDKDTLKLLRHQIASINLSDVEEEMSEAERKEYNASISAVFPRIEKDIKKFLHTQLMFMSNEAQTWEHVIFGRGTYNGMDLLLTHWRNAFTEHNERIKNQTEDKDFDPHSVVGEQ